MGKDEQMTNLTRILGKIQSFQTHDTFRVTCSLSIEAFENDILYPIGQDSSSVLMALS